jgi:hypothetical protein
MTTDRRPWTFLAVLILVIAACATSPGVPSPPAVPGTGLAITAVAGPTCPVEQPGDPACAPRPVAGATVIVRDGQGNSMATVVLDAEGSAVVALPAGGYVVEPRPVEGLMGTAESMHVTVVDGTLTPVVLAYDTGIR